jgi:hypothetical protein
VRRERITRWAGALALAVAVVLGMRAADGEEAEERAATGPPRVLEVRYDPAARPAGARRAYPAVVVRARDPDGQVVAVSIQPGSDAASTADGRCGRGQETWTLPARLRPGRQGVRVTVESSRCDGGREPLERADVVRELRVPR